MGRFLFYIIVIALALIGWFTSESTERVAILFTGITACFSYEGYRYNKEKFRLELFEKRWEVYENVLEFHRIFSENGGLVLRLNCSNEKDIEEAIAAAEQSFCGIGWHKSKMLFGKDISIFFEGINALYDRKINTTFMQDAGTVMYGSEEEINQRKNDIQFVLDNINNLPKIFSPYLYFGDYKYNPEDEVKLCDLCSFKIKNLLSSKTRKDEI